MIPTLLGRWQTRVFLFVIIGLPVTALFAWWQTGLWWGPMNVLYFIFLVLILILGLILDPVYIWIQSFRWERDWPFAFQTFFSWIEFGIVLLAVSQNWLPWFPAGWLDAPGVIWIPILHFSLVFFPSLFMLLGGMQLLFIRWRFKAAEFGRM